MKILLTGGSGFIGKNILENLGGKYSITAPSRRELDILNLPEVEQFMKKNKFDHVIHAAVPAGENIAEETIRMYLNIVSNAKHAGRIIILGSGAEYGKHRDLKKIKEVEFGEEIPRDSYGLGKYVTSILGKNFSNISHLRLFGVYGRYEDYRFKFISNSIVKNLLKMPIVIKQDVVFDYLYINDLTKILEYFLNNKQNYYDYNVVPASSIKLTEIVEIINKIDSRVKVQVVNSGLNYQYTGSSLRLMQSIPDFKFISYKDGIKDLFDYFKKNLDIVSLHDLRSDKFYKISKIKS